MLTSMIAVIVVTANTHTPECMCSTGRAARVMTGEVYGTIGCNLLGDSYSHFPFSLFGPTRVGFMESASTMGATYYIGIRTVRSVSYVPLLKSP